jgi:nitrate reductase delta subunit
MREIAAGLQPGTRKAAHALLTALTMDELITLQEQYLDTFDRGRRTALNLFEHVHGDSRDRGQAMVDLLTMYEGAGMHYAGDQLPDYLPVFLDFVATLPAAQARAQLGEVVHILQSIAAALARRESVYLPAMTALLQLAGAADCSTKSGSTELSSAVDDNTEDDTSLSAIDAAYAEAPVNFLDALLQAAGSGCAPQTRPALQPIRIHRRVA